MNNGRLAAARPSLGIVAEVVPADSLTWSTASIVDSMPTWAAWSW